MPKQKLKSNLNSDSQSCEHTADYGNDKKDKAEYRQSCNRVTADLLCDIHPPFLLEPFMLFFKHDELELLIAPSSYDGSFDIHIITSLRRSYRWKYSTYFQEYQEFLQTAFSRPNRALSQLRNDARSNSSCNAYRTNSFLNSHPEYLRH